MSGPLKRSSFYGSRFSEKSNWCGTRGCACESGGSCERYPARIIDDDSCPIGPVPPKNNPIQELKEELEKLKHSVRNVRLYAPLMGIIIVIVLILLIGALWYECCINTPVATGLILLLLVMYIIILIVIISI
jgi:hypothetical protein